MKMKIIKEYDTNRNLIYFRDSDGYERWFEYDANENPIHYRNSDGYERWRDANGNEITKTEFDKLYQE